MQYTTSSNPIIYPLLPKIIDAGNVETYFAVCRQDIEWVQSITYTGDTRVALLSLLAGFQSLGYFPELSRLSSQVIKHIAHALEVDAPLSLQLNNRTLYRYHQHIRRHLGISAWNKKTRQLTQVMMEKTTATRSNLTDLINATIEALIQSRIELPALSTLRRMAGSRQEQATSKSVQTAVFFR